MNLTLLLPAATSAVHLLGFGIGLGAIYLRARALQRGDLPAALRADNAWGISAILVIGTGLARAFAGLEKGADFYLHSPLFYVKMGLLLLLLMLEAWPMVTLIRWRITPSLRQDAAMPTMARLSWVELALFALMPFAAAGMARGILH